VAANARLGAPPLPPYAPAPVTPTTTNPVLDGRAAGVLLHPTSLPGEAGVGTLGADARHFVDWLAAAGFRYWQILPLVPAGPGESPYSSTSAFLGNAMLVDLSELVQDGLLSEDEARLELGDAGRVHDDALSAKQPRLALAGARLPNSRLADEYRAFRAKASWADEAVLFAVLRRVRDDAPFTSWEPGLRDREPEALDAARIAHAEAYEAGMAAAFFFDRQWTRLRAYASERGVRVLGDLPIYVSGESADVWAHRDCYQLDAAGHPERVAAVPPDAFSETGQLWGNPLWDWDALAERGYDFWIERVGRALTLANAVRLDHFRAFSAYYSVAAGATDARVGEWVVGPRDSLFDALLARFGALPMVAEDLGLIDEEVHLLRGRLGLPGMRILQFAFGGGDHELHLPWHHPEDSVAYTGTHDNDTTLGYWMSAPEHVRDHIKRSLGCDDDPVHALHALVNAALHSRAKLAVVPAQDLLGLGSEARMNTPGIAEGNWRWRMTHAQLESLDADFYRGWLKDADRHP